MISASIKKFVDGMTAAFTGRHLPLRVNVTTLTDTLVRLRSEGLAQRSLPELEIISCPLAMIRYGTEVILQIAANGLRAPEALADGKIVGGRLVFPQQDFLERCRLKVQTGGTSKSAVLRICDVEPGDADGFPRLLIAAHLCALGSQGTTDSGLYFQLATEIYPMTRFASSAPLEESELNPNNFWAWEGLGSFQAQSGHPEEALAAWKNAICRWPRCGKFIAAKMVDEMQHLPEVPDRHLLASFWNSVSDPNIRVWANDLGMELGEGAL